jgi:hypothetical protein
LYNLIHLSISVSNLFSKEVLSIQSELILIERNLNL